MTALVHVSPMYSGTRISDAGNGHVALKPSASPQMSGSTGTMAMA